MKSVEREWMGNLPNISCVPVGFYLLRRHNGTKYKNTYALVGATVSRAKEASIPRYACVGHKATTGEQLQGCFAWAYGIEDRIEGSYLIDLEVGSDFIAGLREIPGPHYLEIRNARGFEPTWGGGGAVMRANPGG
jgi:hypothetical protein